MIASRVTPLCGATDAEDSNECPEPDWVLVGNHDALVSGF